MGRGLSNRCICVACHRIYMPMDSWLYVIKANATITIDRTLSTHVYP